MTGRLRAVAKAAVTMGDGIIDGNATQAERDAVAVLHALEAAILLDETSSLFMHVRPWVERVVREADRVEQRRAEQAEQD